MLVLELGRRFHPALLFHNIVNQLLVIFNRRFYAFLYFFLKFALTFITNFQFYQNFDQPMQGKYVKQAPQEFMSASLFDEDAGQRDENAEHYKSYENVIKLQNLSIFSIVLLFVVSLAVVIHHFPRFLIFHRQRPYTRFLNYGRFVLILTCKFGHGFLWQVFVDRVYFFILKFHVFWAHRLWIFVIYALQVNWLPFACLIEKWLFNNNMFWLTNSASFWFWICQTLKIDDLCTCRRNRILRALYSIRLYSFALSDFSRLFLGVFVPAIYTHFLVEKRNWFRQRIHCFLHILIGIVPALDNFPIIEFHILFSISAQNADLPLPIAFKIRRENRPWFALDVQMSRVEPACTPFFV